MCVLGVCHSDLHLICTDVFRRQTCCVWISARRVQAMEEGSSTSICVCFCFRSWCVPLRLTHLDLQTEFASEGGVLPFGVCLRLCVCLLCVYLPVHVCLSEPVCVLHSISPCLSVCTCVSTCECGRVCACASVHTCTLARVLELISANGTGSNKRGLPRTSGWMQSRRLL